jgi:hypothetical protein
MCLIGQYPQGARNLLEGERSERLFEVEGKQPLLARPSLRTLCDQCPDVRQKLSKLHGTIGKRI